MTHPHEETGFSLVEALLSVALFAIIATGLVGGIIYAQQNTATAGSRSRATFIAEEGLEAVRNMRDVSFSSLTDGTYGLTNTGSTWAFSGTSDTTDIFTRVITISTIDAKRKQIVSTVTWQQTPQRTGNITLTAQLSDWRSTTVTNTPTPTLGPSITPTLTLTPTSTPTPTRTPTPASCAIYCTQHGFTGGTCRQNVSQCTANGQVAQTGGNAYCTVNPNRRCCCSN